jgi:hypothetical protein
MLDLSYMFFGHPLFLGQFILVNNDEAYYSLFNCNIIELLKFYIYIYIIIYLFYFFGGWSLSCSLLMCFMLWMYQMINLMYREIHCNRMCFFPHNRLWLMTHVWGKFVGFIHYCRICGVYCGIYHIKNCNLTLSCGTYYTNVNLISSPPNNE